MLKQSSCGTGNRQQQTTCGGDERRAAPRPRWVVLAGPSVSEQSQAGSETLAGQLADSGMKQLLCFAAFLCTMPSADPWERGVTRHGVRVRPSCESSGHTTERSTGLGKCPVSTIGIVFLIYLYQPLFFLYLRLTRGSQRNGRSQTITHTPPHPHSPLPFFLFACNVQLFSRIVN